jgi:hypothetical protein
MALFENGGETILVTDKKRKYFKKKTLMSFPN